MLHLHSLWLYLGSAPIRLSTAVTLVLALSLVTWRLRSKGWFLALYHGVVAALFTLFLYEILFNITGRFPPTGNLPPWGIGLMVLSLILGITQAIRYFAFNKMAMVLLSAFVIDWAIWIITGFQFNFPDTQPLNTGAEVFNISTKFLLPLGYIAGLTMKRKSGRDTTVNLKV